METETAASVRISRIRWAAVVAFALLLAALAAPAGALAAGPPTVASVIPNEGREEGGTKVTITGNEFTSGSTVKFGVTSATSVTVNSANSITAVAPAGIGTVDVTVTTLEGTSAISQPADQFSYVPPPTVTAVEPSTGPQTGGTTVAITGTNFTGGSVVMFGATSASNVKVNSASSITAESPAGTGLVNVTVTTPGGTSKELLADQFSYVPPPTVTKVSPAEGPEVGTTSVTITGTNLGTASAVKFGTANAKSFMVNRDGSITAESPAGTATVHVTVTTPGGTSATSTLDQFSYIPPSSTPPSNSSGGQAAPPATTASTPSPPLPPTKVALPLISNLHERLVRGTTLEVSFRLTVKARVRMIARRGRKVIAKTQFRTLAAGNHRLLLVLSRRRWPTKLELQSRALAPLPTISQ
jgi:IPT/TIG domain